MKSKSFWNKRTIIIVAIAVVLLATATTLAIVFLRDGGRAAAAQQDDPGTSISTDQPNNPAAPNSEEGVEAQNPGEGPSTGEGTATTEGTATPGTGTSTGTTTPAEPEYEYRYVPGRGRYQVGQDFQVGWTPIEIGSVVPEIGVNRPIISGEKVAYIGETPVNIQTVVKPGDEIRYMITATNSGSIAKEITIKDEYILTNDVTVKDDDVKVTVNGIEKHVTAEDLTTGITETINGVTEEGNGTIVVEFTVVVGPEVTGEITNVATVDGKDTPPVVIETENITGSKAAYIGETPVNAQTVVKPGDEIRYVITATNSGSKAKAITIKDEYILTNDVTVKDDDVKVTVNGTEKHVTAEDLTTGITETINGVTEEENGTIIVEFTVVVGPEVTGEITNVATVDGKDTPPVVIDTVNISATKVAKRGNVVLAQGAEVENGDVITYVITLVNTGSATGYADITDYMFKKHQINLRDITPSATNFIDGRARYRIEWDQVPVSPDAPTELSYKVTINDTDAQPREIIRNNLALDGKKVDETELTIAKSQVIVEKSLISTMRDGVSIDTHINKPGDILTYAITIKNRGNKDADVTIVDNLGSAITYLNSYIGSVDSDDLEAIPDPVASTTTKKVWNITMEKPVGVNLENTKILYVVVRVNDVDENDIVNGQKYTAVFQNEIEGYGDPKEEDPHTVVKSHIISGKTSLINDETTQRPADNRSIHVGDTINYTIRIENDGSEKKDVVVKDAALKQMIDNGYVELNPTTINKVSNLTGRTTTLNYSNLTSTAGVIIEVLPGEVVQIKFSVTVLQEAVGHSLTNTAVVDGSDRPDITYPVTQTNLTVNKTSEAQDASGNTITGAQVGDYIKYTITATNDGNEAGVVTITENLPAELDFASPSITVTPSLSTSVITNLSGTRLTTLTINNLQNGIKVTVPAGGEVKITFRGRIKTATSIGTPIINTISVEGEDIEGDHETENPVEVRIAHAEIPLPKLNVILVIDKSYSMVASGSGGDGSDRLTPVKNAARNFIDNLLNTHANDDSQVSIVTFSVSGQQHGNTAVKKNATSITTLKNSIGAATTTTSPYGHTGITCTQAADAGTNLEAGLTAAKNLLQPASSGYKNVIIVLTDGTPTVRQEGVSVANSIKNPTGVAQYGNVDFYGMGVGDAAVSGTDGYTNLQNIVGSSSNMYSVTSANINNITAELNKVLEAINGGNVTSTNGVVEIPLDSAKTLQSIILKHGTIEEPSMTVPASGIEVITKNGNKYLQVDLKQSPYKDWTNITVYLTYRSIIKLVGVKRTEI